MSAYKRRTILRAAVQKVLYGGRKEPYTERGISRVPCARCGEPSKYQWQVCANDNRWMGVCAHCDVALNAMVLHWFQIPDWKEKIEKYQRRDND